MGYLFALTAWVGFSYHELNRNVPDSMALFTLTRDICTEEKGDKAVTKFSGFLPRTNFFFPTSQEVL